MTKLLKCPFCGGEAELDCANYFNGWFVKCTKCSCKTTSHSTEFFAKVSWNTRKPVQDVLERLEEVGGLKIKVIGGRCNGKTLQLGYQKGIVNAIEIVKEGFK